MSQIDDLPDYEEDEEPMGKKYKVDSMNSYKRPEILPHFIILGHGQVRSYSTFQNIYRCNINYFCTRGNVMLGYIDNRQYLIEQMNKMCNKNIIVKEVLKYGEEIDNTEFSATNEIEQRVFGIYVCENLDAPIFRFDLSKTYTLEELLHNIRNYTINYYNTDYFEVSIIGCRPVDDKPYIEPKEIHTERLTGSKRKYSQIGSAKKSKKRNKRKYKKSKKCKKYKNFKREYKTKRKYKKSKRKYKTKRKYKSKRKYR